MPSERDRVTGDIDLTTAFYGRSEYAPCGPDAKLFEEKKPKKKFWGIFNV
jgi:hypothetical protein